MSWLSIVFKFALVFIGSVFLINGARCFWWSGRPLQSQPELIPKGTDPSDPEVQIIYKSVTIFWGAVFLALSTVCFYIFFLNFK